MKRSCIKVFARLLALTRPGPSISDERGNTELLISFIGVLLVIPLFFTSLASVNKQQVVVHTFSDKVAAELYAEELVEFFRSLSSMRMKQFLMLNPFQTSMPPYFLCSHVNILDRSAGGVVNADPMADLPIYSALGTMQDVAAKRPNRYYQVSVIDISTMTMVPSFCSVTAPDVALFGQVQQTGQMQMGPHHRFFVSVGVSWLSKQDPNQVAIKEVKINTILPK